MTTLAHTQPPADRLPMALLDRDGVINVDVGYPYRPDQIIWIDGVFDALVRLKKAGFRVVVVSNQSGVARGLYSEKDVDNLHTWMQAKITMHGGEISRFYYCPYHPEALISIYRQEHLDRKPKPGMLLRAFSEFDTDMDRSFMIGDRDSDMIAAKAAGVKGYLFNSGNLDVFMQYVLHQQGALCN